jgi:uncharacterized protein
MIEIITLCIFAFLAGFINGTVGGGGLVQTPALLITLTHATIPQIMGTAKCSSIMGSSAASFQFSREVTLQWRRILGLMICSAFVCSFIGAGLINYLDPSVLKPTIWVLLVLVFIYILLKKEFGQIQTKELNLSKSNTYGFLFGCLMGLYDGFFGPGTGSFLIIFFVTTIGFDFVRASAHARVVNLFTNLAAFIQFALHGSVLWHYAIPMGCFNMLGSYVGVRAALLRGNKFVRTLFLCIIACMILRYGYDIFLKK